jgi:hypothetical protein
MSSRASRLHDAEHAECCIDDRGERRADAACLHRAQPAPCPCEKGKKQAKKKPATACCPIRLPAFAYCDAAPQHRRATCRKQHAPL